MVKSENKQIIKSIVIKVAVAFLAIVALLTYFSGTIDNYLLPHVTIVPGGEGSLKYPLKTSSKLEVTGENTDEVKATFRFNCSHDLDAFVSVGSMIDFKALAETGESRFAYRDGTAAVTAIKESADGFECTAEVRDLQLQSGDKMPASGVEVIVDTVFETPRYKHIVMKSAIKDDSYVYLVTRGKDNKHYVSKVEVTVIAESDFYAAVEMDADSLPFVMTSSKAIRDGQRVIVDG